jgi:hypothetical protein
MTEPYASHDASEIELPHQQTKKAQSVQYNKGNESHFGTKYRKTPLPADKKGPERTI